MVSGEDHLISQLDSVKNHFYCLAYFVDEECIRLIKRTEVKEFEGSLFSDEFDVHKCKVYHTYRINMEDRKLIQIFKVGSE